MFSRREAINIVKKTQAYHILIIVADGQGKIRKLSFKANGSIDHFNIAQSCFVQLVMQ
jgi:hypothetical protein